MFGTTCSVLMVRMQSEKPIKASKVRETFDFVARQDASGQYFGLTAANQIVAMPPGTVFENAR